MIGNKKQDDDFKANLHSTYWRDMIRAEIEGYRETEIGRANGPSIEATKKTISNGLRRELGGGITSSLTHLSGMV